MTKGATMLKIRLFCSGGMSTSLLVRKMEEAAAAAGAVAGDAGAELEVISKVTPEQIKEINDYLEKADILHLLYSDYYNVKKMQKPDKILMDNSNR